MKLKRFCVRAFLYGLLALVLIFLIALFLIWYLEPDWSPFLTEDTVEETLIPSEGFVKHTRSPYLVHLSIAEIGAVTLPKPYSTRWRTGIGIPDLDPMWFKWPALRPGWYLNWTTSLNVQSRFFGLWRTLTMNLPD